MYSGKRHAPPRDPTPASAPLPPPPRAAGASRKTGALAIGVLCGLVLGYILVETASSMRGTRLSTHAAAVAASDPSSSSSSAAPPPSTVQPSSLKQTETAQRLGAALGKGRLSRAQPQPLAASPSPSLPQPLAATSSSTSTSSSPLAKAQALAQPPGDSIHSVMTSSGSGYQNFQGRIMYGTYKLVQRMPGGEKLTGFTRILHRVHPDECMEEIPTFHAAPLHPECDVWCDFPVADRPNAVQQWIDSVRREPATLKGAWVALLECDYVWMKPLPSPGDAYLSAVLGWQYHFGYIIAQHPDCAYIIKRLYGGGDPADVPNSGPAPAVLRFTDLQTVTPLWVEVTAAIERDKEAVKVLGWVREMYAWDIALAQAHIHMDTQDPPHSPLISQPPSDLTLGNASIFHYTWGAIYNDTTQAIWRWDKRDYTDPRSGLKLRPIPMPPPMDQWQPNKWHLQDGVTVGREVHQSLTDMLAQMNKAIEMLPDLTERFAALTKTNA